MNINKIITEELDAIANRKVELPSSIVIYNFPKNAIENLFNFVSEIFSKTKEKLLLERMFEIDKLMFPYDNLIREKYKNLQELYKDNRDVQKNIFEWREDSSQIEYNLANKKNTYLKKVVENMELVKFNVHEFYEIRDRIQILRQEIDTTNLDLYHNDPEFRKYYKKKDNEIELENHSNYIHKRLMANYIFLYNVEKPKEDKYDLEYLFAPLNDGQVNWSIILFHENFKKWCEVYSEEFRNQFITNKKLFNYNNNDASKIVLDR